MSTVIKNGLVLKADCSGFEKLDILIDNDTGEPGVSGDFWGSQEGCQGPSRPSGRNRGLPLRRRGGQGPHLAKRWEPRGFSRVAAGFSSYDGDLSLPLGLALGSPIFPSGCDGKLGLALESLQG